MQFYSKEEMVRCKQRRGKRAIDGVVDYYIVVVFVVAEHAAFLAIGETRVVLDAACSITLVVAVVAVLLAMQMQLL